HRHLPHHHRTGRARGTVAPGAGGSGPALVRLFPSGQRSGSGQPPYGGTPGTETDVPTTPGLPHGQHHRTAQEPPLSAGCLRTALGGRTGRRALLCRQDRLEKRTADRAHTSTSSDVLAAFHVERPKLLVAGLLLHGCQILGLPLVCRRLRLASGGSHAAGTAVHG